PKPDNWSNIERPATTPQAPRTPERLARIAIWSRQGPPNPTLPTDEHRLRRRRYRAKSALREGRPKELDSVPQRNRNGHPRPLRLSPDAASVLSFWDLPI